MEKRCIRNGADRDGILKKELRGQRVGLITNPTGVTKRFFSTADRLFEEGLLSCLFAPEHGVRGDRQAGEMVESYTDPASGLPVFSLYGGSHHLSDEALEMIDTVVFDIQDVGARFYTYIYTLSYALEDCAAKGKRLVVLDRVNPLGGTVEGSVLDPAFSSFVGRYPIATRHGLTVGEFARYINKREKLGAELTVIEVEGWERGCLFDGTDLSFIPPSPNLPTADSCLCYIGTCPLEGTNLSEGRGTTRPFELLGAPWLDGAALAREINAAGLPGVTLRPCCFTPTFSKHAGSLCSGVQLHVTDRGAFRPFETGLRILAFIREACPEFELLPPDQNGVYFIDRLFGDSFFSSGGTDIGRYLAEQEIRLNEYRESVKDSLIY